MISHSTLLEEVYVIIWWSVIFWYLNQNEKETVEKPLPQTCELNYDLNPLWNYQVNNTSM